MNPAAWAGPAAVLGLAGVLWLTTWLERLLVEPADATTLCAT